jgi:hypothetical protein
MKTFFYITAFIAISSIFFSCSGSKGVESIVSYHQCAFREGPSPKSKVIGAIPQYSKVTVLDEVLPSDTKNVYYKIIYKGKKGYVLTSNIQKGFILGTSAARIAYRKKPDGTPENFIDPKTLFFVSIDKDPASPLVKIKTRIEKKLKTVYINANDITTSILDTEIFSVVIPNISKYLDLHSTAPADKKMVHLELALAYIDEIRQKYTDSLFFNEIKSLEVKIKDMLGSDSDAASSTEQTEAPAQDESSESDN